MWKFWNKPIGRKHEKKIWKVKKLIKTSAYVTIGKLLKSIAFSLKKKIELCTQKVQYICWCTHFRKDNIIVNTRIWKIVYINRGFLEIWSCHIHWNANTSHVERRCFSSIWFHFRTDYEGINTALEPSRITT